MEITKFETNNWKSPFWKIRGIFRAMLFAWKNPRHAQVAVNESDDKELEIEINFSGLNEKGLIKVLEELGVQAYMMDLTEQGFKQILEDNNGI